MGKKPWSLSRTHETGTEKALAKPEAEEEEERLRR